MRRVGAYDLELLSAQSLPLRALLLQPGGRTLTVGARLHTDLVCADREHRIHRSIGFVCQNCAVLSSYQDRARIVATVTLLLLEASLYHRCTTASGRDFYRGHPERIDSENHSGSG